MKHDHSLLDELNVETYELDGKQWAKGRNVLLFVMLLTWLPSIFGLFTEPAQFYHSYLTAFFYFMTVIMGAMFFVMVGFLTGSAWSIPVRRFMETIAAGVPLGALLFIPIFMGLGDIYEWSHGSKEPAVVGKLGYLNPQFFLIRAMIYFAVWSFFAVGIYRQSTKQDRTNSIQQMHAASRLSAPGLLLTFVTVTLASFDWVMSLDPRWYSTIFGLYCFAGGALCFMAFITLIALSFQKMGILTSAIGEEHYHDLGKWMFAVTVFWTYMAVSQYLLIWYVNLPEETIFYKNRMVGSWLFLSGVLLFGHFIIPFLVLIARKTKRSLQVLGIMAGWIALMHYCDMYWLIMPNFSRQGISLHWLDFATLGTVGSAFAFLFWWRLGRHALAPIGDLRFQQGLAFRNI